MLLRIAVILGLAYARLDAADIALRNVTVIDGTGAPAQPRMTILVRDDRISAIGPVAKVAIPPRARVVDGRGRYAIPGLWDMHVHLWYPQNQLPVYVAHGVTGVRDMGSDFARTQAWRSDAASGRAIGPHVVTSGPPVAGQKSGDEKLPVIVVVTPEDARRAFDRLDEMGVDFVKILSDVPHDAYVALAERARKWRMPFAGHVPTTVSVREAIDARQHSIEHLFGVFLACSAREAEIRAGKIPAAQVVETFDEQKAIELFKRSALYETRQVPTLTLWERMSRLDAPARVHDPRLNCVPPAIRATWPEPDQELKPMEAREAAAAKAQFDLALRMVGLMQASGVEIMAGTDTGDPYTIPGVTLQRELELLVEAGLTPMQAIQSATVIPARYLGWDESVGKLAAGMVADIVLLDANPLADIRNVSRISGVSVRGRYLAKPALTRILSAVK